MATAFFDIGPSPHNEPCATVGAEGYRDQATKECQVFANQLRRQFGTEPPGAKFQVKSHPHEAGKYLELVVRYDNEDPAHIEFVRRVEAEAAAKWDEQAKAELGTRTG